MRRLVLALGLALPLAGCGLISSDIDNFTLSLPEKAFEVNTDQWGLTAGTVPTVPCTDDTLCATAASSLCTRGECSGVCATNCEIHASMSLYQTVNLAVEKPELKTIDKQNGIRVTIQTIEFTIDENTLNVDTPELAVFCAPVSVLDPAGAQLVGHIPVIPMEMRTTASISFVPGGDTIMNGYMSDYETPFNIIVSGDLVAHGGDPIPQGRVAGRITGTAVADAL